MSGARGNSRAVNRQRRRLTARFDFVLLKTIPIAKSKSKSR